jgi:hypothetical protein
VTGYTFFPAAQGIFSKINHILPYKESLNKYKKNEIFLLSDQNRKKVEIHSKRNFIKYKNIWMLNNNLSNDQWITKELHGWGQN